MPEGPSNGLIEGPMGVRMPPEAEVPLTFVYSRAQADIHIFVPENASLRFTNYVADNFSRRVQQPVRVFHDKERGKYRLCPIPEESCPDTSSYGRFCFTRDQSAPVKVTDEDQTVGENGRRIPRPRNCWLLYRQAKSQEITTRNEGITASELSSIIGRMWDEETPETQAYWHRLADQEEHNHSRRYPGYKYSPTKESGQEIV
uniref:Mating type protein 1-1-3 n=1 Tax=Fusarium anguioides TaxID=183586 RepID=A0A386H8A3_9HYPO|nr:mating type protein 1-1-3 [Fusarium anguioides]